MANKAVEKKMQQQRQQHEMMMEKEEATVEAAAAAEKLQRVDDNEASTKSSYHFMNNAGICWGHMTGILRKTCDDAAAAAAPATANTQASTMFCCCCCLLHYNCTLVGQGNTATPQTDASCCSFFTAHFGCGNQQKIADFKFKAFSS